MTWFSKYLAFIISAEDCAAFKFKLHVWRWINKFYGHMFMGNLGSCIYNSFIRSPVHTTVMG